MAARSVLGRMMAAGALVVVVLLSTGAVASAQGIDPFQPKPSAAGSGGSVAGSTTSPTTSGSSGTGSTGGTSSTGSGSTTGTTVVPSTTGASPQSSTGSGSGSSLAFTGSQTLRIFVSGLLAIFVGVPLVRAGRRRWDARHWPAC